MLNILSQFIKYFTLLYLSLPSPHGDAIISTNSIFYLKGSLLAQVEIPKSPSKYFLRCHKNECVSNIRQLVIILISREQGQGQVAMLLMLGRSNGRKYLNLHRSHDQSDSELFLRNLILSMPMNHNQIKLSLWGNIYVIFNCKQFTISLKNMVGQLREDLESPKLKFFKAIPHLNCILTVLESWQWHKNARLVRVPRWMCRVQSVAVIAPLFPRMISHGEPATNLASSSYIWIVG